MKVRVLPFTVVSRGSALEPLTPVIQSLLVWPANREPGLLALAISPMTHCGGEAVKRPQAMSMDEVALLFSDRQRRLFAIQKRNYWPEEASGRLHGKSATRSSPVTRRA